MGATVAGLARRRFNHVDAQTLMWSFWHITQAQWAGLACVFIAGTLASLIIEAYDDTLRFSVP